MQLSLSEDFGLLQPLLFRVFGIASWDSLSGLCALWDSLSSVPCLWLGRCTLWWLDWSVIGFPLLGVHPSVSIVKLTVIGYHCNHLDGQLNYWASAHWLIGVTIMYQLHEWWFCHYTLVWLVQLLAWPTSTFTVFLTAHTIPGLWALLLTSITLAVHTTQTKSMYCLPYFWCFSGGESTTITPVSSRENWYCSGSSEDNEGTHHLCL